MIRDASFGICLLEFFRAVDSDAETMILGANPSPTSKISHQHNDVTNITVTP